MGKKHSNPVRGQLVSLTYTLKKSNESALPRYFVADYSWVHFSDFSKC